MKTCKSNNNSLTSVQFPRGSIALNYFPATFSLRILRSLEQNVSLISSSAQQHVVETWLGAGKTERYCFFHSFMTLGILYLRYRIAVGRFVAVRSMCGESRCGVPADRWRVQTRRKPKLKGGNDYHKTDSCFMSLLIYISLSTWIEMLDGWYHVLETYHVAKCFYHLQRRILWICRKSIVLKTQHDSLKVKVKLSLCLTKHHAMKAYWGV
jgi:hypothetical protein